MRKKVLLIIPNLDYGGAQRSFSKLSFELDKKYDLSLVVFNTYDGVAYPHGGKLYDLSIPGSSFVLSKIFNFILRVIKVHKLKKRLGIDVAISFLEGADYVNILSGIGDYKILSMRGSKSHDETITGWLGVVRRKLWIPFLYNYSDKIVSVNQGIVAELISEYKIKNVPIEVIPNWYEISILENLAEQKIPEYQENIFKKPTIISFGRLAIEKGYNHLIKVFNQIQKKIDCNLILIGDGPYKNVLFKICEEENLKYYNWESGDNFYESRVYFLGYQENPFKYVSRADVFVLTSSSEGFPNSLAEAMATEIAVLSTDCPSGPKEILSGTISLKNCSYAQYADYGILMPMFNQPNSFKVWADVLIELLEDKKLRKGYAQAARNRIKDFQKKKVVSQWFEIIDQAEKTE